MDNEELDTFHTICLVIDIHYSRINSFSKKTHFFIIFSKIGMSCASSPFLTFIWSLCESAGASLYETSKISCGSLRFRERIFFKESLNDISHAKWVTDKYCFQKGL